MSKKNNVSIYLSYILRHRPDEIDLKMDKHGWVDTKELISKINAKTKHHIDFESLELIVKEDKKGRYKFNEDKSRIKACQGHSIPWVEPELTIMQPPKLLYHGTNTEAYDMIMKSGSLEKKKRHAVHLQDTTEKAWQSATRWHKKPVLIEIDAEKMYQDGYIFGMADNGVWCTEEVPVKYFSRAIYTNEY